MLHKSFKPAKCKTSLKLAVSRIKLLRNRRAEQVKKMKRELAQLLETGQEQTARIRVEHVIREEKTLAAYDLIELYCELIVARLPIIESQKTCPIDLKEAISTVIFASPRCADVPELMDIRKHFAAKYGKDFITSSLEVRPDCGVSRLVVEKLSARAPDVETKVKILKSVSEEHNVKWESKAFEEENQKPHKDLLNGPDTFSGTSKISMESSNTKPSSPPAQTNESNMKMTPNTAASRPTSSSNSSQTNTRTPDTRVPFNSQSGSRSSENRSEGTETKNSYSREENARFSRPNWNMEFQDATSAARAAAESAERASMAARAAVELASREHMSRQDSTASNDSTTYNRKYEKPERLRGLLGEDFVEQPVASPTEVRRPQEMKIEEQSLQADERMRGDSRREAGQTSNDNSTATKPPRRSSSHSSQAPSRSSSHSSQAYADDDNLDVNLHKDDVTGYGHSQRIFSESEDGKQNPSNQAYMDFTSSQPSSSQCFSSFDEKTLNSNIHEDANYECETTRMSAAGSFRGSNRNISNSGDYSAVVFDDYKSDTEDSNLLFGRNEANLSDSYEGEEPSHFGFDQDRREPFARNSGAQLHLFKAEEHSGTEDTVPAASFDSGPVTFDDSDVESIENEVAGSTHNEMRPSNSFGDQRSIRSSFSDDSIHGSSIKYTEAEKGFKENIPVSEGNKEEIVKLHSDEIWKRPGSSNQPSPRSQNAYRNTNDVVIGSDYSSSDDEDLYPLHSTKRSTIRGTDAVEKLEAPSGSLSVDSSEISNNLSSPSEEGINFSNLTGGFKHRGFPRPPYVRRSSNADSSHSAKQASGDTSFVEKPTVSQVDKPAASFDVADQKRQNMDSRAQAYASKSISGVSVLSSSDSAKGFASHDTPETSEIVERNSPFEDKVTEVDLSHESLFLRSHGKGQQKEVSLSSSRTYYDVDSSEQSYAADNRAHRNNIIPRRKQSSYPSSGTDKLTPTKSNKTVTSSEVSGDTYNQEPSMTEPKVSRSKINYLKSDGNEENFGSTYSVGSTVNTDVKLSRRTRDMSSDGRSNPKVSAISSVKSPFRKENQHSQASLPASEPLSDESYKPLHSNSLVREHPSKTKQTLSAQNKGPNSSELTPIDSVAPTNNLKSKPSSTSGDASSREGSVNRASHTHPKLPDYESLAAHFHSLRSNQR